MQNNHSSVAEKQRSTANPGKRVPFAVSEAYKNIRTNLISILNKENKKVLAFSSPNASEGKSTTAINVAISLAQLNKKVLLIDSDAHRPSLHSKLKLDNSDGLMNVIAGISTPEDVIHHYNPFLDIITTGPITKNPTEAFSTPDFDRLLDEFRAQYDYVIFDTPPLNLLSDGLVISQKCDGLVIVTRSGNTTHEALCKALSSAKLLNIHIFGLILNASNSGRKLYYKNYYKSYK